MTVQLAPSPVFQAIGSNGLPLAFGQVFTYIAGTTSPQATWIDSTQTTQNTNPVILNAFGQASIWLATNLTYKIVVEDSLGNQLYSQDQIAGGFLATPITGSIIPATTNTYSLGSLGVSWANLFVGPNNAPVFDTVSGNVGYYKQTSVESAATVIPTSFFWPPGHVFRYGAVGNGTTDDSAAFATAALISGTYPIQVPFTSGGYKVNTAFALPANGAMQGYDRPTIFSTTNGQDICYASGVATITIDGIIFKGNNSSTTPLNARGGYSASSTGLVTVVNCTDVRITNCEFNTFYNGVCALQCTRLWINKNKVTHWLSLGICASVSSEFMIDDNDVVGCDQAGGVVAYGITATGNQNGGLTQQRNSISFNRIASIPSWDGIMSHDFDGLEIIGNDIRNVRQGIDIGHLVSTNFCRNLIVSGNMVEGTTTDTWSGTAAVTAGIDVTGFDATHRVINCAITGNVINNFFNMTGSPTGAGNPAHISINDADHVTVSGNAINNGGSAVNNAGVEISGTVNSCSVTGNVMQGTFALAGIRLATVTADAISIYSNTIIDGSPAANYGIDVTNSTVSQLAVGANPSNSTLAAFIQSGSTLTPAINTAMVKGTATFAGVTAVTVTHGFTMSSSTYQVSLSQSATSVSPPWITAKSVTQFTINFSANYTGNVDWQVVL